MLLNRSKFEREQLQLRHCAARDVWPRRFDRTPSGITWAQWFHKTYGLTLHEYQDWLKENNAEDVDT